MPGLIGFSAGIAIFVTFAGLSFYNLATGNVPMSHIYKHVAFSAGGVLVALVCN